ncbi:asparagine synthase-related protein [Natronococcus sp.]|uniref:asparagine synthase-related protein n=1 Tax=Natronococcus sp. TaxID=35747 RepID=UPI003A4E4BB1
MEAVDICCSSEWANIGNTWVSTPHDPRAVARRINSTETMAELSSVVSDLPPPFALITKHDSHVYCATDHLRSIPLYYRIEDDQVWVGNNVHELQTDCSTPVPSFRSQTEFLSTGYVHEDRTLYPEFNQVCASELLAIDPSTGSVTSTTTDEYLVDPVSRSDGELRNKLISTLDSVTKRLIQNADGRQLVVPLSGGYDSRLILLLLIKHGYENILTYSHGQAGNAETETARTVAKNLGVDWINVTYRPEHWRALVRSDEYDRYLETAFNGDRLPGIVHMNWLAVKGLTDRGLVEDDCLFLPGHTAATMAEHLPAEYEAETAIGCDRVIEDLFEMNFWLWDFETELAETCKAWLRDQLSIENEQLSPTAAATVYERWEWLERESKWIHADLDIYRYFDVGYRVPLWDREFFEFWQTVPMEHRIDKRLLTSYTDELYARYGDVDESKVGATERDSVVRQGYYALRDSPLFKLIRPVNSYLRYRKDPSGWPAVLPEEVFSTIYTGNENRHSFFALEMLNLLDFKRGEPTLVPTDGTLTSAFVERSRFVGNSLESRK